MDSRLYSQADFASIEGKNIMERAEIFGEFLQDVRDRHHLQYRRVSLTGSEPVMRVIDPYDGQEREMIYLASNDYFNLTKHPRVIKAGHEALDKYGAGAGSVPLLGGTTDLHEGLEQDLARFKGCESAVIYTSGFGSNAGTLISLLQKDDCAILDMLVHASIVDGCQSTNIKYFLHNNMESLERALKRTQDKYRTRLVAVDGVYSMDGDIAPLDEIVELAHKYGAFVMVDEAHATGVLGENGRGTPEHFHLEGKVDIVAGTLSKGLGGVGGFIASRKELIDYIRFYSRPYIFSTGMTPQAAGSLREALRVIEEEPELRERLWDNIRYFRQGLQTIGFNIGNAETAIFPIIIGDDLKVKEMVRLCHEANIYVNPVVFPAVSKKMSRVRISLMAQHTKDQLDRVLDVLESSSRKIGVI